MSYVTPGYWPSDYVEGEGLTFAVAAAGLASTLAIGSASFAFSGPAPFAVSAAGTPSTLVVGSAAFSFSVPFAVSASGRPSTLVIGSAVFRFTDGTPSTTPAGRTLLVPAESRVHAVPTESRYLVVPAD